MPAAAPPRTRARRAGGAAPDPVIVPFSSAAHEHTESFLDVTVTPGASVQNLGPYDVPAFGYMRHVNLECIGTGGTLGAGVLSADYPFNLFSSIQLADVNGAPIFGPLDGYATAWANIIGSYVGRSDPRLLTNYVGTINGTFQMRVPIEISHRDGFGALANQNAAAAYKLFLSVNPTTVLYTTAPTTPATWRIRGALEAWTLPNERDVAGRRQAEIPPMLGTTQYWSAFTKAVAVGQQSILLPRVGNLIRALVIIARSNAANLPRDDTVFPNPATLSWDARQLRADTQNVLVQNLVESLPALSARDAGVFAYMFNDADHNLLGDDTPTFWLPTVQSSRLQIDGAPTTAGNLQIMTCDIAPAEVRPDERYVETSASGFHPALGVASPAAQ